MSGLDPTIDLSHKLALDRGLYDPIAPCVAAIPGVFA